MSIVCECDLDDLAMLGYQVVREGTNEWSIEYRYNNRGEE